MNFENMPLNSPQARRNLVVRNYPSGHMVYLDDPSRSAMKSDLVSFYQQATQHGMAELTAANEERRIGRTEYRRRMSRTPY